MILAVVDEVAHRDGELGVGMSLPGRVQRGGPYAVIAGLRVGKYQGFKFVSFCRVQANPGASLLAVADAVFVGCAGRQLRQHCFMDIRRYAVVRKGFARRRDSVDLVLSLLMIFYDSIVFGHCRLPHDGPRRLAVFRNDLAYVHGVYIAGELVMRGQGLCRPKALLGCRLDAGNEGVRGGAGDEQYGNDSFQQFLFIHLQPSLRRIS